MTRGARTSSIERTRPIDSTLLDWAKRPQSWCELGGRYVLVLAAIYVLNPVFVSDIYHFHDLARSMTTTALPYRDVSYEFPPLTLVFVLLERLSFDSIKIYRLLFATVMIGFEYGSLCILRRAFPADRRALTTIWHLMVLPLAGLVWFRFDFAAMFFALTGLLAIEQRKRGIWVHIMLGWGVKLFPAVLIAGLIVRKRWRDLANSLVAIAAFTLAWIAFSPSGFGDFLELRAGGGLEIESLPGALRTMVADPPTSMLSGAWVVDPNGYRWVSPLLTVVLLAYALYVMWLATGRPTPHRQLARWDFDEQPVDLAALTGSLILASFLFSRIISAQYVTWVAPFAALMYIRGHPRIAWLNVVSGALTFLYLTLFDYASRGNRAMGFLATTRNLLLCVMLWEFTAAIRHTEPTTSSTTPRADRRPWLPNRSHRAQR